jgi:tungstate transport system ATP-binding protein
MDMRAQLTILPLRLNDVTFQVDSRQIIRGISTTIEAGMRTIILGPNGAGKSVLLRLCHGLLKPTSGAVVWNASELASGPRRQAMVFQRPVMLRRSALGNVTYALRLAGVPHEHRRDRAFLACVPSASSHTPITPLACYPAASSSGWRLRASGRCIPRCCSSTSPRRTWIPGATHEIEKIIASLHAAGTKIVMVTHNLGQAHRLGDEILFMHGGRLLERAPADRFLKSPASDEAARFLEGELPW